MFKKSSFPFDLILLLIVAAVIHFVDGDWTAFEWTTTQDIPALLQKFNPGFLQADFYTNSIALAPRILYTSILEWLTRLTGNWYGVLYGLKLVIHLAVPVGLWGVYRALIGQWGHVKLRPGQSKRLERWLWLFALAGGLLLQSRHHGPAGWGAIQAFDMLSPMTLSFALGLFFMWMALSGVKRTAILLAICTLIHPVVGLSWGVVYALFVWPISTTSRDYWRVFWTVLWGAIAPVSLLFLTSQNLSVVEASTFIQSYVVDRHPHHYLMSKALNGETVKWLILFLIPLVYCLKKQFKKEALLTVGAVTVLGGAIGLQAIGTEWLQIKSIAILGPSRFTAFTSLIWMGVVLIVYQRHLEQVGKETERLSQFHLSSEQKRQTLLGFFVVWLGLFTVTYTPPLGPRRGTAIAPFIGMDTKRNCKD